MGQGRIGAPRTACTNNRPHGVKLQTLGFKAPHRIKRDGVIPPSQVSTSARPCQAPDGRRPLPPLGPHYIPIPCAARNSALAELRVGLLHQ